MSKTIGRYEIQEELGRGGMAAVYLAFDPRLDRRVALKLMDHQLTGDPAFAARFEREAKTVASLEHSAIVPLHDYGETDSWLYLVMRYMKGGSLKEQIARGPLAPEDAYSVVRRIGDALDRAHAMGVIHRDLKPGNILLDEEGKSYLSDFGIVKVAEGEQDYLTETGQTLGTFAYMSPEQLLGNELDGRSDIYALGIVLYEMLTGVHPFGKVATTSGAMVIAHTQQPVPDITDDNPDLPSTLAPVIQKALAKDPADRYASGAAMASAVAAAVAGAPQATPSSSDASQSAAVTAAVAGRGTAPSAIEEKSERPGWLLPVAGLALIVAIAVIFGIGLLVANLAPDGSAELTRVNAELTLAADRTQVAVVITDLPEEEAAKQTRTVATLTQEAALTQQAEAMATATPVIITELPEEEAAEQTRSAATLTHEAALTQQAEATAKATPTATADPNDAGGVATVTGEADEPDTPAVNPADEAPIVYIPGGHFTMGLTEAQADRLVTICADCSREDFNTSQPAHPVEIAPYWIYRVEVTNEMYARCVDAGHCIAPVSNDSNTRDNYWSNPSYASYPVVNIDWHAAQSYCIWAGGRLPTEAEWEFAARGSDGRLFPWGDALPSPALANVSDTQGDTTPVGSFPNGASPFGVLDMSGNVWEWVADWYEADYYAQAPVQNPQGPNNSSQGRRVGRGGSWFWDGAYASTAYHDWWEPYKSGNGVGFRCALDR